jgi:hypothetical protein
LKNINWDKISNVVKSFNNMEEKTIDSQTLIDFLDTFIERFDKLEKKLDIGNQAIHMFSRPNDLKSILYNNKHTEIAREIYFRMEQNKKYCVLPCNQTLDILEIKRYINLGYSIWKVTHTDNDETKLVISWDNYIMPDNKGLKVKDLSLH